MSTPDNEHQTPSWSVLEVVEAVREHGPLTTSRDHDHRAGHTKLQKRIQIAGAQVLNPDRRKDVETEWADQFYVIHALAFGQEITDAVWDRIRP